MPKTIPIPGPGLGLPVQETTVPPNSAVELLFTAEGVFWRDLNGNSFTGKLFQGFADNGDEFVSFTPEDPVDVYWRFLPSDGSAEAKGRILVRPGCEEDEDALKRELPVAT